VSERWHIVDTYAQNRVLQVCHTERQAQRAQRKWNKLWVWHNGPKTTIRRVAVRDEE
jgi:hypothetical protein